MKKLVCLLTLLCLILPVAGCNKKVEKQKETATNTIDISGEEIEGKASIDSIKTESGHIKFKIKNLTSDNKLLSAYMTYTCYDANNEELSSSNMDADYVGIGPGEVSEEIDFAPPVLNGTKIIVTFRGLGFENSKDNFELE
ncbi:hypothetical protein [Anaerosporobacter sp.]